MIKKTSWKCELIYKIKASPIHKSNIHTAKGFDGKVRNAVGKGLPDLSISQRGLPDLSIRKVGPAYPISSETRIAFISKLQT
jgi:hypothetical protein